MIPLNTNQYKRIFFLLSFRGRGIYPEDISFRVGRVSLYRLVGLPDPSYWEREIVGSFMARTHNEGIFKMSDGVP